MAHRPPDDELIPLAPNETLAARSRFPALDPIWNMEKEGNTGRTCPNPKSPQRDGVALPGPKPPRARTEEVTESETGDKACSECRAARFADADVVVNAARAH